MLSYCVADVSPVAVHRGVPAPDKFAGLGLRIRFCGLEPLPPLYKRLRNHTGCRKEERHCIFFLFFEVVLTRCWARKGVGEAVEYPGVFLQLHFPQPGFVWDSWVPLLATAG
ncbi:hypothetical protein, unlikely [Trypanosoma brucei gambiense DAL972]|uniref:Uncharacterized protein n=1 Tax=Trypanosoma brucei gambiense (strain MHOM/CI/86/DAL972) TaxID=679716 RepID=C9ZJR6_TRYB9|nr:hypothetical protein, unlikely [Trypanosoma brucei gambiense DAL972]CBH09626.1 hypothetical protein, unlikely [Trypanosoma brucei gambiense DAL972]|eukprot:XP_011771930.1 hypothetical protein, unlikely [Trypanosoma brucei gambiense DAL972]